MGQRDRLSRGEVRAFAIENALHWLSDYRFDGLRLDAVQQHRRAGRALAAARLSAPPAGLRRKPAAIFIWCWKTATTARAFWTPTQDPPQGKYRAQWNDDYHHAWRVLMTGEKQGYYCDYQRSPISDIARSLSSGFVYQGEVSAFRGGESWRAERPSRAIGLHQFPAEPRPDRQSRAGRPPRSAADARAIEAALTVLLIAPGIPMLFMGEEWGSKAPFPFFCDFGGELADAVRKGRRIELAWAYAEYGDEVPDALAPSTRNPRCSTGTGATLPRRGNA